MTASGDSLCGTCGDTGRLIADHGLGDRRDIGPCPDCLPSSANLRIGITTERGGLPFPVVVVDSDEMTVARCGSAEIAGRIIACVNACQGIETAQLENDYIAALVNLEKVVRDMTGAAGKLDGALEATSIA